MAMSEVATNYARLGLAVFPVESHGKKPLTEHGCKDASTDIKQIKIWWDKYPEANIGIATGKKSGGIYVIDLDVDDDRGIDGYHTFLDWQRDNGDFPDSWVAITGRGGYHLYFKSKEAVRNRTGILDGVDIRGEGGYVVAPPSIHHNGRCYEWEYAPEDITIAYADDMLDKLIETTTILKRPDESFQLPDVIPKGQRNDLLFKAACSYQSKGLPDAAIFGAVMELNRTACETPLPEDEVKILVGSALKYDKGNPDDDTDLTTDDGPHFEYTKKGMIVQSRPNVVEALEHDKELSGMIKYNELAYSPYVYGKVPWEDSNECREWSNADDSNLYTYLEGKYGLSNKDKIADGLDVVIHRHTFNPVIDMLMGIHESKWDGQRGHIENLLPDYMGVEKNKYSVECMQILMLGAINRVFYPGCKFDYMPVLVGKQGIGKSTFFRYLAMDSRWYNDNFNTIEGDKASEKLRGMWMVEMAELLATKKAKEVESIKSFLTSTTDTYRPPYGRRTEQRKRMCVFVGTTNSQYFLTDQTGNRRFLPLIAREDHIKKSLFEHPEEVQKDFENAWGEAIDIFLNESKGSVLILSKESNDYAMQMQNEFTEEDARVGMIQEWLDNTKVNRVCASMLYKEALGYLSPPSRTETRDLLSIMSKMDGWEKVPGKSFCSGYGTVFCYDRIKTCHEKNDDEIAEKEGGFVEIPDDTELPFD